MGFGQIEKASKKHFRRARYKQFLKQAIHRRERQRSRADIESLPQYRRFCGWEY